MSTVIAKINQQMVTELPKDLYIDPNALQVFLEMFEGPLDLLLYLIRRQNLDILAIPITKITNQYITYINAMQVLNIDLAAEYLLMAAMLLEIKSRMLLPKPKLIDEDESNDIDPRQELIQKLIEYEQIKEASQKLAEIPLAGHDYLYLEVLQNENNPNLALVSLDDLKQAWQQILLKNITSHKEHLIQRQEVSIREHMANIIRSLSQSRSLTFFALFDEFDNVTHIVVNFMAILELTKEGIISLHMQQNEIIVSLKLKDEYE
jgi:segregation and condensation protein A